jgi:hypothetical protein
VSTLVRTGGAPVIEADARLAELRSALAAAQASWGERGGVVLATGLAYADGAPVLVAITKRLHRYDIDDRGGAVRSAGRPAGWLGVAREVVAEDALNVNRRGVVFVPAVEGRDLASLALRVAYRSLAVHEALLELGS